MRGKKDVTTFPDKPVYKSIKPLKSEAIHETGLSGNVVASFFPLIIYIYIYIVDDPSIFLRIKGFHTVIHAVKCH